MRKTIRVDELRTKINSMLAASTGSSAGRIAIASVLEQVLIDTGNYRGFSYLDAEFENGVCVSGDVSRRTYH